MMPSRLRAGGVAVLVWHQIDAALQPADIDKLGFQRFADELDILFSPGSKFGQSEVVHFEEPSCDRPAAAGQRRYLEPEHASFPSGRRPGRFRSDPVRVVPVGLVEERSITDRTVDLDRPFWIVSRVEVSLHRAKQACGRGRELSEDRLTTNDDDLIPGDIGRRVDEVLELDPVHEAARASTARAIL